MVDGPWAATFPFSFHFLRDMLEFLIGIKMWAPRGSACNRVLLIEGPYASLFIDCLNLLN